MCLLLRLQLRLHLRQRRPMRLSLRAEGVQLGIVCGALVCGARCRSSCRLLGACPLAALLIPLADTICLPPRVCVDVREGWRATAKGGENKS